ncbi:MAG: hypothetical protein IPP44_00940 [Ideonella sp.]|nr:hypothetical protein [Ideonella sp.]
MGKLISGAGWPRPWRVVAGLLVLVLGVGSWAVPARAAAAATGVLLTILDGEAVLRTGANGIAAAEGLRLPEGTLLETAPSTRLLRLEWPDGSLLDLGPDTMLMLQPGPWGRSGGPAPAYYLLRGWAKQVAAAGQAHRGGVSPQLDVLPGAGVLVLHVTAEQTWAFAEAGDAHLAERGSAGTRVALEPGQAYLRQGVARGEVAPRPHPEQLKQVPKGFRDTIGPRAAQFKGRPEPKPVVLPAPGYAALQAWLTGEPALRRDLPKRFAVLLKEPGFRAAVDAKLKLHPEWEPVLRPPLPKPSTKPYEDKR